MNEPDHYEIIVKSPDGEEISLKLNQDEGVGGWVEKFKVILKWLTFHEETISEAFASEE